MRTTMRFADNKSERSIISPSANSLGEALSMAVYRIKKRRKSADKNVIYFDEETGHLRVGQGNGKEMELISGTRVLDSTSFLPSAGKTDTLYVCLDTGSMYVWNNSAKTWVSVSGGGGGAIALKEQVLVYDNRVSFPVKGEKNTLYATKKGEAYIYDTSTSKYISITKGDSYTRAEADDKFEKKGKGYTKAEADDKFATKDDIKELGKGEGRHAHTKDIFVNGPDENILEFTLSKIPSGHIMLYVNGLLYENTKKETNYTYNKTKNTITWTNTDEDLGGFTLEDAVVAVEYYVNEANF